MYYIRYLYEYIIYLYIYIYLYNLMDAENYQGVFFCVPCADVFVCVFCSVSFPFSSSVFYAFSTLAGLALGAAEMEYFGALQADLKLATPLPQRF